MTQGQSACRMCILLMVCDRSCFEERVDAIVAGGSSRTVARDIEDFAKGRGGLERTNRSEGVGGWVGCV